MSAMCLSLSPRVSALALKFARVTAVPPCSDHWLRHQV
jgi:hypothetical protein